MKILIPFVVFTGLLGFAAKVDAQPSSPQSVPPAASPESNRAGAATPAPPQSPDLIALPDGGTDCCDGMGGPEESEDLDLPAIDALLAAATSDQMRWRLPDDSREARRVAPPAQPVLNRITIRF